MSSYGDAGEPEGFLAHQEALRRLARSLLADPLRAEDLVQETWLAARGRSPRRPEAHRAWLAGILRHLAWKAERGERRRRQREQSSSRPEAWEERDDVETALATQRRILQAVQELDEPYRTAIVLRYYRDLTPAEISKRLGTPVGTVKTRLRRGLGMLRARLQREHGGEDACASALLLLAGRRWAPAPSPVTAGLAAGAGGIVGTKLWIGVAAAIVAAAGLTYVLRERAAEPPPPRVSERIENAFDGEPASGAQELAEPIPGPRQEIASPATAGGDGRDTGSPAWRLLLRLDGLREQDSGTIAIQVRTSTLEAAFASFERALAKEIPLELLVPSDESGQAPGQLHVELDHPSYMPARVWVIVPEEVDSETSPPLEARVSMLPALGIVTGKVEIEGSGVLEKPVVALFGMEPSGKPRKEPTEVVRCSPDGSFRLRSPFSGTHAIVAAAPSSLGACTRPANVRIELEGASPADAGLLHLGPGAVISGQAFLQDGRPPGKGEIRASMSANASRKLDETRQIERIFLVWTGEAFENREVSAPWDGDGRFLLQGLAPGEYRLSAGALWKSLDARIPSSWVNVPEEDLIVVTPAEGVRFEQKACSQLFVVRGLGAPLARATMRRPVGNGSSGTMTDDQGRIIIVWSTNERQQVTFEHVGFVSKSIEIDPADVTPGQAMYVDLEPGPPPGRLLIRPRGIGREVLETEFLRINLYDPGAAQRPVTSWGQSQGDRVHGSGDSPSPPERLESGDILISDLRPGRHRILLQATSLRRVSGHFPVPMEVDVEIAPGATEHLDWTPTAGGIVRINYKDASGSRVTYLELRDEAGNDLEARFRSTTGGWGQSLHGSDLYDLASPVVPGHYVLSIRPRGLPARTVNVEVRAGETTDIELDVDAR